MLHYSNYHKVFLLDLNNYSEYHIWAGNRIRSLVEKLTEKEFTQELNYFSQKSIREICLHIIMAQEYCLAVINKMDIHKFTVKMDNLEKLHKEEIITEWQISDKNLAKELQTNLDKEITFPFRDKKYKVVKYDFLLQYPSHTIYHRGQLIIALKKLGKEVVGTDYLFYLMEITNPET